MATYLLNIGHTVSLPKRAIAPTLAEAKKFADKGDIYAEGVDELLYGRLSNVL